MTAAAPSPSRIGTYQEFLSALLSNRELFFDEVVDGTGLGKKFVYSTATIVGLAGFFGLVAGAYSGPFQAISAAIKLPLLLFATFVICFPAFYVVQVLVGSRLRLAQIVVLVFGALALTSILLAAFVPIIAFFLISGANYYFQHLLNIAIAGVAGLFGMYALHEGLAVVCDRRGVYPKKALTIMRAWAVLFAFVGVQLAWNLRPFLGDRNESFQVFGKYQGNFYAAVIYSVNQLFTQPSHPPTPGVGHDSLPATHWLVPHPDSLADTARRHP